MQMTSTKPKPSKKREKWSKDTDHHHIQMRHEISPEALAMGDTHNMIVAYMAELFDPHEDIADKIRAALRDATSRGAFSTSEDRMLSAMIDAINVEAKDLGLEKLRKLRAQLIDDRAGDLAIGTAGVAVSSVEFGLTTLDDNAPLARRRRRLWIALADVGGAIVGGVVGGVGGAGIGASLASGVADAALS